MQDFGAVNTFGDNSYFDEATKFAAEQDFTAAQTFDKYQYFDDSTDFTAVAQTFATGTSFGSGTTFNTGGSQSLVAGTIPPFGVMLDSFTCDTASCLPSDTSKFLAPGDLLASGIDPTATYTKVKPTDKTLTIDGLGLTMTFETVSTAGTIKTDLYNPALIPDSSLNGNDGRVLMYTSNSGNVQTIGSVIDLTPDKSKDVGTAASTSGTITITMPYKEANIPEGTDESQLTMLHYVNGFWQTEDSCTVDAINNKITCVVTSLSPFAIGGVGGGVGASGSGSGGKNSCDSNGFGQNKSLRVYQVMYNIDTYEIQVQVASTCGSISAKITTPMQQSILGLSEDDTLLGDGVAIYSGYLDGSDEKFNISIQNKRDSFIDTFYINDNSIIKKYSSGTGYTSEQQNSFSHIEPSVQKKIVVEPSITEVSQSIKQFIPIEKQTVSEKSVIGQTQSIQYTPEPIAEKIVESPCGIGAESINGICKIIIPDEQQFCFLFWCW